MAEIVVELGNHYRLRANEDAANHGITYMHIPLPDEAGVGGYNLGEGLDVEGFRSHLEQVMRQPDDRKGVTNWDPAHDAFTNAVHPFGHLPQHFDAGLKGTFDPEWIKAGNDDPKSALMADYLSQYFQKPKYGVDELPPLYHDMYWRRVGGLDLPPGVIPGVAFDPQMLVTNIGRVAWIRNQGGGQVGYAGTATASSATSLTGTGTPWSSNQWAGYVVVDCTTGVYGIVNANTTSVLTVDQWYNPATPGGAAGTTPGATDKFIIMQGGATANQFMGITTTNITPAATDAALSGEATANGMGRKICTFTQTSGTSPAAYTLAATFTYSTTGSLTFYADGLFLSNVKLTANDAVAMVFETVFNASATVSASGDAITVTETVTGP